MDAVGSLECYPAFVFSAAAFFRRFGGRRRSGEKDLKKKNRETFRVWIMHVIGIVNGVLWVVGGSCRDFEKCFLFGGGGESRDVGGLLVCWGIWRFV